MTIRESEAQWQGSLREGSGRLRLGSGVFEGAYSFPSRFENGPGTNPEELIAAAHAGCFTMALASVLGAAGHVPQRIRTVAKVHLGATAAGPTITRIELETEGAGGRPRRRGVPGARRGGEDGLPGVARAGRRREHHPQGHLDRGRRMTTDGGEIMEADKQSAETAEIMRRFNDVFQRHDPSGLDDLVAEDCVIENTVPAPDGARYVGREACLGLWRGIATAPGTSLISKRPLPPAIARRSAGATAGAKDNPCAASI